MDKPVAAAPTGAKEKVEKQARQLAYDVRYKTKQSMAQKSGGKLDPAQVQKAYMSQLAKSPAPPAVKSRAKQMLMGEDYKKDLGKLVSDSAATALYKVFVEHHQKDANGNVIVHDENPRPEEEIADDLAPSSVEEINEEEKQYKVRVTDKKTSNSYVRMATRSKISELRANPNVASVEMTEYGTPTKSEKYKGSSTAKVKQGLDPVGKEDKDVNNDGKVNKTDSYLMNRRKAIGKAMAKEEVEQLDELSDDTLIRYGMKAQKDKLYQGVKEYGKKENKYKQRSRGLDRAANKLADRRDKKDKDKNQNEEFLADGTTSTEPSGKKINPKGVDNYKSGAVKIAPVDEADPQNGYGVKEEVEKKDNRANYAYINFMKNKLRAGMGIKNPMVMVDPDKAKEKFEKMATSITASTGEEEEKEGACESVEKDLSVQKTYDPLSNKGILEVSEKLLKKNFNLGEEGYDIARDEGRVKPSKDKKDGTSYPPSEEMKKTQKVNKGPSALEIVKKKYGKAVMDVDKKKKDKK